MLHEGKSVISNVQSDPGWIIADATYGSQPTPLNLFTLEGVTPSVWTDYFFSNGAWRPLPSIYRELSYDSGLWALTGSSGLHMFYVGTGFSPVLPNETFVIFTNYECHSPQIDIRGNPTGAFWISSGEIKFVYHEGEESGLPDVKSFFVDFECNPKEAGDDTYNSGM